MKFRYTTSPFTDRQGRFIKRPLVEVTLSGPSGKIPVLALLDSGADSTLIRADYARALGIPLNRQHVQNFIGIGPERMPCFLAPITLQVRYFEAPFMITAGFIDSRSVDVLLGQADFFEHFRVRFEKDHDMFELVLAPKARR